MARVTGADANDPTNHPIHDGVKQDGVAKMRPIFEDTEKNDAQMNYVTIQRCWSRRQEANDPQQ